MEEAKKLMADDDDDAPKPEEDTGPKIKMGRIGKKKKKGTKPGDQTQQNYTKKIGGVGEQLSVKPSVGGGFSENDIEFMKKAI